jgi:hypothetical protein
MGWVILGGFLAYWYILKKHSTQDLVNAIQNELSNFRATNTAGVATGAVYDAGSHLPAPGSTSVPLGITSAKPSQANLPVQPGTVRAGVPYYTGKVGILASRVPSGPYKLL